MLKTAYQQICAILGLMLLAQLGPRPAAAHSRPANIWSHGVKQAAQISNEAARLSREGQEFTAAGSFAAAEQSYRRAFQLIEASHGPEHPETLLALNNVAAAVARAGRYSEASQLFEQVYRGRMSRFGSDHRATLVAMTNLATSLSNAGEYDAAETTYREAIPRLERTLGNRNSLFTSRQRSKTWVHIIILK